MSSKTIIVLCMVLLLPGVIFAGTTGKISGTVTSRASGEALIGVNVYLEGTTYGSATDENGRYFILNVPAGRYSLVASMVGFARIQIDNLNVIADFTAQQDIRMEEAAIEGETVTITAERPIIQRDQTATTTIITSEDIANLPTRGYQDVVQLQAGVIPYQAQDDDTGEFFRGMSLRGGRRNETAFYVDGFSQQDYLTGVSTTSISNSSIDQITVLNGGFNAEYGRVMSGVVNVITKGGSKEYHGAFDVVTDAIAGDWIDTHSYDYKVYEGSFSGPFVPGNDVVTFYLSSEVRDQGDFAPRATADGKLPHNSMDGITYHAKIHVKPSSKLRMEFGTLNSFDKYEEYFHSYKYNLEHAPRTEDKNYSIYGRLVHTINASTFYNFSLNYFYTERFRGDGLHFDDYLGYGRPLGNPLYDNLALFYDGDDPATPEDEGHVFDDILHRESSYIGAKFDMTSQLNAIHQLKGGFEYQRHTLRLYHHLFPKNIYKDGTGEFFSGAFQDLDIYGYDNLGNKIDSGVNGPKHPNIFAAYVQDKIEFENLVINAGLRYDYIDPATEGLVNELRPLEAGDSQSSLDPEDLTDSKVRHKISPRIGVGFPVSLSTLLHFNYGKFYQQPNLQDLYVSYDYLSYKVRTGGYFFGFGNPNLKPETTTAYEAGVTQAIGNNTRIDVTAYYKRVVDLVQIINQPSFPSNFATFRNQDFGVIKGVDVALDVRNMNNFTANLAYSLSFANGTGSTSRTQRNIAWTADHPPKMTAPLDFDQRHKLTAIIDYRLPRDGGPSIGGFKPFSQSGVNMLFTAGSGFPYTPTEVHNEVTLAAVAAVPAGPINSVYGPWTWRMDMKLNRLITAGPVRFNVYLWALNVFNRKNMMMYYTSSGKANTTTWIVTPDGRKYVATYGDDAGEKYKEKEENPLFYGIPRQVRLGVLFEF